MASHLFLKFSVLIFISVLCLRATADSVLFLNTTKHPLLRPLPSITDDESSSILLSEVAATVSILLGSAPPASVPPTTSSKLSQLLLSNPFNRPVAVLMLDVGGVTGQLPLIDYSKTSVSGAVIGTVVNDSHEAEIEILDEDELSVISLDDHMENKFDAAISDGDLDGLATWLGGSYAGSLDRMDGVLTFPLASGKSLKLHMSKEADHDFVARLFSLASDLEVMLRVHEDSSTSMQEKAELLQGCFTGIQALQEQYGPGSITEQAMEIFLTALIKSFDSVQEAYKGQIAGVVLFSNRSHYPSFRYIRSSHYDKLRYRPFSLPKEARILAEDEALPPGAATVLEQMLVRRIVAWITGIVLLVATLIGAKLLFDMPITRDTLLYTNVKFD